jgi:hypothetical protein
MALLGEVARGIGVKAPKWVILFPDATFPVPNGRSGGALVPQVAVGIGRRRSRR